MKIVFIYLGVFKVRGRMFKQIKSLQDAGHECSLLHGRVEDEEPDYSEHNYPVEAFRVIREKNKMLTFVSLLLFNRWAARKVYDSGADAIVCIALQSALSGVYIKKKQKEVKFIFDNKELALEMIPQFVQRRVFGILQKRAIDVADVIMHAEKHRVEYFHKTYPCKAKPFLLENLPYSRPRVCREAHDGVRVVCLGALQADRYCIEMLEAFADFNDLDVQFDLVGYYGRQEDKREIEKCLGRLKSDNIRVLPPIPHKEIYEFLKNYDIGLAFYKNLNLNNYYCAPNKVYDYLQMGLPLISNDYPGLKDVIEKNNVGVCLSDVTPENIRDAVRYIIDNNIFANINEKVRKRYSWENQEQGYLDLFC